MINKGVGLGVGFEKPYTFSLFHFIFNSLHLWCYYYIYITNIIKGVEYVGFFEFCKMKRGSGGSSGCVFYKEKNIKNPTTNKTIETTPQSLTKEFWSL